MNIHLTRGLLGNKVECIAEGVATYDNMMHIIHSWKEENKDKFSVAPYLQLTFDNDKIGVDFGDYSYFLTIDEFSKNELADMTKSLKH